MSGGAPKVLSMNISEQEPERWLVLGPAGNKTRSLSTTQKPLKKEEEKKKDVLVCLARESSPVLKSTRSAPASVLRRQELLLHSNLSMNASCSSDASTDSFCSRASTGRIGRGSLTGRVGRRNGLQRTEKIAAKLEKAMVVPEDGEVRGAPALSAEFLLGKRRCAWVMPNTDPQYAVFHDEEWGVPVHNDRKLFELLVLSGALAELTWPTILSKRHIFREVFVDFDPVPVSKLNEKKLIVPGGTASSLLSEPKLRAIIENARQLRKIIDEFGSFDRYCWAFVNHKPITSRFRYPRQVPAKTPKADVISKDLVRRGFRSVSPTVIYTFMQVAGLTNDHLITCYRFEECAAAAASTIVTSSEEVKSNITCDSKKEG